jgi:GH24 family phage-related lysozyme (muramidase)
MNLSAEGINLIKRFEGVRSRPYRCSAKLWTVGVGHLIGDGKSLPDSWNRTFTEEEINALLIRDLNRFERGVRMYIKVPLRQCEYDSLCSFAFNLGLGTLQRSTLRQKINRGDKEGAAKELLKYCRAGGKIIKGLQIRREAEYQMFLR